MTNVLISVDLAEAQQFCLSCCHSRRESALRPFPRKKSAALLLVIPEVICVLPVIPQGIRCPLACHSRRESASACHSAGTPLAFCLSFPKGICVLPVIPQGIRCPLACHSRRESASACHSAGTPLAFCLSFPKGIRVLPVSRLRRTGASHLFRKALVAPRPHDIL